MLANPQLARTQPYGEPDRGEPGDAMIQNYLQAESQSIESDFLAGIKSAEDWWAIVLGSGYRGTIEQLTLTEREKVKEANVAFIRDEKISAVETNVLYALATKPQTARFE